MAVSLCKSATATASSSLCIVALVRPNSTTGHKACRKRASDVPPVVDISGITSVSAWIASATSADRSPGGVRKASPEILPTTFARSEEHTSELQSLMRISYAVFCLKKKKMRILDNRRECKPDNKLRCRRQRMEIESV